MGERAGFRHTGLFAGIGGFELGLSRAGHELELLCEIDAAARAVLKKHFAGSRVRKDICALRSLPRNTNLVTAGFPCQDLSQAGRMAGINGSNSGLVGEVFRLLRKRQVPWVLIENVPFMLQLARGQAADLITTELEKLGYNWAYRVIDTRAFGLPQRRLRVFLLASLEDDPRDVLFADEAGKPANGKPNGKTGYGFYWTEGNRGLGWAVDAVPTLKGGSALGVPSPPAIWLPTDEIVKPDIRDAERLQGFPANWTKPAEKAATRGSRWRLVGNAVSVPVAEWIGRRLARPGKPKVPNTRELEDGRWPKAAWNVGEGRCTADISDWPKRYKPRGIVEFLKTRTEPLSYRAANGFLQRVLNSSLRVDDRFIEALEAHVEQMKN